MKTYQYTELQQHIIAALATNYVTSDQLYALVCAATRTEMVTRVYTKISFRRALMSLVNHKLVERTIEPAPNHTRYRMPTPLRYSCRASTGIMAGWELRRNDPGENCTHILGYMSEAEAHCCVEALNELDRKAR